MAEEGLRIAETVNHPFSLIVAYYGLSVVYLRQGDVHRAIPVLERAMGLSPGLAHSALVAQAGRSPGRSVCAGWAYRRGSGAGGTRGGATGRHGQTGASGARGRLAQRGVSAGGPSGRRAPHAPRRRSISPASTSNAATRPGPCGSWARARRARRPPRSSQPSATTARPSPWPRQLGMCPLQAHCHRGLGTLYARQGQQEQARAALATAIALYRDMEMTFWLPQAEAVLAQVG